MQVSINLIKALSQSSADEQALLAALLNTLHLTNLLKLLPFPNAEKVSSRIKEEQNKFLRLSTEQRVRFLTAELAHRTGASTYVSEEDLSLLLLQRVAQKYGIDVFQPPLSLAREVLQQGLLNLVRNYLDVYQKADETGRQKMRKQIEEALRISPSQVVEELRKLSSVEKMTAEALLNVMKRIAEGGAAIVAINSVGFSAYIALSTIIHTVFTTLLGITLPFGVYTTASTVLSVLTGPVGWGIMTVLVATMLGLQGKRLNEELLNMTTLSALMHWYQNLRENQEMVQDPLMLGAEQNALLPAPLREQTTQFAQLRHAMQQAEKELSHVVTQIRTAHQRREQQQQRFMHAVEQRNELQARIERLAAEVQQAERSRERLRQELEHATQENFTLRQQLLAAENRISQLGEELKAATELMEEVERRRIKEKEELDKIQTWVEQQVQELQAQKMQAEQTISLLRNQLQAMKTKRKEDYCRRFQRLMTNLQFYEKALDWFAEQTDENLLLAAERVLLDLNYSAYPPSWGKTITGTQCREIHFAKDYRLYFHLQGSTKTILVIGHKNEQKQHIEWLKQQRVA